MTLGDIAIKARSLTNTDASSYADANLLIDINIWYQKIVTMIQESRDAVDFDDATITTTYPIATRALVAARRNYDFATGSWTLIGREGGSNVTSQTILPLKVKRVDITYDNVTWYHAEPLDDGEIQLGLGSDTNIDTNYIRTAPRVDIGYNSIAVYPMATAADVSAGATMRVEFERNVVPFTSGQLTTGTLVPGFDAGFHPMLAYGPAFEYSAMRNMPQLGVIQSQLQDWEARLRLAYGRKDIDRVWGLKPLTDDYYGR